MRRTVLFGFAGIFVLSAVVIPRIIMGARTMAIPMNVKDLPEHNLKLVGPGEPSFQRKLLAALKDQSDLAAKELQSYSVLLENHGKKPIVGYRVRWEMLKSDGSVVQRESGGVNPGVLMEADPPGSDDPSVNGGYALRPGAVALVSMVAAFTGQGGGTLGGLANGSADRAVAEERLNRANGDATPSLPQAALADLQKCTSINVSLDAAVFSDGSFVGPDTTGFFASVDAYVSARRDLLEEMSFATKRNQSADQVLSYVEEIANEPYPARKLVLGDLYTVYKKMHAEAILRARASSTAQRIVDGSIHQCERPWPKLKKL